MHRLDLFRRETGESQNPATNQNRESNWLAMSWEQDLVKDTALGNAVADVTVSDSCLADVLHPLPTSRKHPLRDEQPNLRPKSHDDFSATVRSS